MSNDRENHRTRHVIGIRPDGSAIVSTPDFPLLPIPHRIGIGDGIIQIDDWFFFLYGATKRFLIWFKERLDMWIHLDPSDANKK